MDEESAETIERAFRVLKTDIKNIIKVMKDISVAIQITDKRVKKLYKELDIKLSEERD